MRHAPGPVMRAAPSVTRFPQEPGGQASDAHQPLQPRDSRGNVGLGRLRLQPSPLGNHPVRDVAPQRDDQASRDRDNAHAAGPCAGRAEPPLIPLRQRAGGLIPQPAPRHLRGDAAHRRPPTATDPLIDHALIAAICR